jgi:hypothetical protein
MDPASLDDVIRRLLEVRNLKPGKNAQLSESEIKQLCASAKEIFLQQPNLLELEAPIKICGTSSVFLVAPEQFLHVDSISDVILGIGLVGQRVARYLVLCLFGSLLLC